MGLLEEMNEKLDTILGALNGDKILEKSTLTQGQVTGKPAPKPTTANGEPEIASRNRWLLLTDGTMVAIEKGQEMPPVELRVKNVKKVEFDEWEASALGTGANPIPTEPTEIVKTAEDFAQDTEFSTDEFDEFAPEQSAATASAILSIPFEQFKQIVMLYGSEGRAELGRELMAKHSTTGATSIAQYEHDQNGRGAILRDLRDNWERFDEALSRVGVAG